MMSTEQEILKLIRKLVPNSKKYLFDDAAIIENNLIVTTDALVENTHFTLKTYSPFEIGWKALAVNLSDIAAMGGKPLYALVSFSLPKNTKIDWIRKLYKGILSCAIKNKTQIIGGNLTRSKEINISIAVIGKTVSKDTAKRSNAKVGDLVFSTGRFGDSAYGYLSLKRKKRSALVKVYKMPVPQIHLGQKIVKLTKRVALIDSSDGLADCLLQLAKESKVKMVIFENKIPISKLIKKHSLNLALYGGEDYELVGTASKNDVKKLLKTKKIKIIGVVQKGSGAFLKKVSGKTVKLSMKKSFKHFK